ncbi:MAG: o-succinylbenzoate synthase [Prevotella sp.]|nr:o-succinylbenzoate synthase [Prevotella sp.]
MMQITISDKILHFKQPAGTSRGVYTTRHSYYVTIEKDGIRGIGECATLPDLSCDTLGSDDAYRQTLSQLCQLTASMGSIPYDLLRPYPSMLFGLETAMAQVNAGGSLDFFHTPFGRGEEGIPMNGLVWMGTFEEMYARMKSKLDAGFHCIKLKIGAIDWDRELSLVQFIRQHFSKEDIELRVDANGGFTPENAMSRLEQLAKYDVHSIEQPIRQHQWREMAALCRNTPLPIALDEELIGVNLKMMKEDLLDTIRPQYIILKPSLHGGMRGTEEWIALARSRGIGSWITSALESNIGLNAIAQLAAKIYGPHISMPQGLGTGQLFTDNIPLDHAVLQVRGDKLWLK